jgi:predicted 2-oxoglutarate/Fe(II)-dependent dioxygenase YbiX
MKTLFDYVLHIENYLSEDICLEVIEALNTASFDKHSYNDIVSGNNINNGDEELSICYNTNISNQIVKRFSYAFRRYDMKIKTPYVKFSERTEKFWSNPRFNKYGVNTKMNEHVDHIHTLFDGERKGIPILTLLGFLNDDYVGGDLYLCGEKIKVSAGQLIIFPSNFLYPHRVDPIISGTRYSWVSWVW